MKLKKKTAAKLDTAANASLFTFNAASIALVGLDYPLAAGVAGLLSEPAFAYMAWKAKSWALWVLTAWWTGWWGWLIAKHLI